MNVVMSVNAAWNIWNFRQPLVEALLADGHTVTILAPRDDTVAKLEALGCAFRPLSMNVKGLNPLSGLQLLARLRASFRDLCPDVVLSFTIKNNIFGAFVAKSAHIPFIPNVTGLGTAFLSGGFLERVAVTLYRRAFKNLPVVFFQNEDDRDLFVGRGLVTRAQARQLPGSGIDLKRFAAAPYPDLKPDQSAAPVFLMIGRLLRDKGVLEYVEAARIVKAKYPEARFQLLGATDTANRTAINRDVVRQWEKQGVIEYLGTTEDVRPVIASAHCVVLPSYREGAPRTLIEAAALARPLVATDVPGCRAVVDDGRTGFLCEIRNAESLAAACEKLIKLSPEARREMGQEARMKMEREFDQCIVVDAYRTALRDVMPSPRGAS